jgi:hypothetical protein
MFKRFLNGLLAVLLLTCFWAGNLGATRVAGSFAEDEGLKCLWLAGQPAFCFDIYGDCGASGIHRCKGTGPEDCSCQRILPGGE